MIASTYGRDGLSAKVGRRSEPTTASISFCAFCATSGCNIIMRKKWRRTVTVYAPDGCQTWATCFVMVLTESTLA